MPMMGTPGAACCSWVSIVVRLLSMVATAPVTHCWSIPVLDTQLTTSLPPMSMVMRAVPLAYWCRNARASCIWDVYGDGAHVGPDNMLVVVSPEHARSMTSGPVLPTK